MAAAKDNVNTKLTALISLVGVLFLVFTIMGTDAVYFWSESLAERGKEAGDSTEVEEARFKWRQEAAKAPAWVNEEGIPQRTYAEIPLEAAKKLILQDRKPK